MNDDLDRQVCASLKKALELTGDWQIEDVKLEDPGYLMKAVVHKGEALEQFAFIRISWREIYG